MRFFALSVLSLVGAGMVSARPSESLSLKRGDTSECVGPLLCCGTLTTPSTPPSTRSCWLSALMPPTLSDLSVLLVCHGYDSSCETKPQCCTEANLLGGTVALGCADLK
ncbi:fungal hydrophobin [Penicillium brevicompactum]|uniref:fungal hydrophobin n=1 Tax=Penicillium brevicompactum TaxID=5074 RepID=UPI00253F8A27|nr:fungal hydrophobin [Penicillium brevicompactum]KAJ5336075.1 fungal hydrophobin [Penicillium brevicompactum]